MDYADFTGAPAEFLPRTPAEARYDAAHRTLERAPCAVDPAPVACRHRVWGQCDAEYVLNAGALIADRARRRLLLFFDVSWRLRSPPEDVAPADATDTVGAGIASWSPEQHPALQRLYLTHRPDTTQPSPYAFGNGRPPTNDPDPYGAINYTGPQYGEAPVIPPGQSRYLYLYDTTPPSAQADCGLAYCYRVKLARVPLSTMTHLSTWRFYAANSPADPWKTSPSKATYLRSTGPSRVTSAGPPNFSVTYNAYLRKYIMVYQRALTQSIGYRTAPNPWGPWSDDGTLPFREQAPGAGGLTYAAQAHDEFSQQYGKLMYVTYVASNTSGGVYVVKMVFR